MPNCTPVNPAVERFRYQLPSVGRKTETSDLPSPSKSERFGRWHCAGTSKASEEKPVFSASGDKIAHVRHAERELKLTLDKNVSATFAAFLVDQLPTLFDAFSKTSGGQENPEA